MSQGDWGVSLAWGLLLNVCPADGLVELVDAMKCKTFETSNCIDVLFLYLYPRP